MPPILTALFVLVIIGVVLYLIEAYVPMAEPIKIIIRIVIILLVCLYLLSLIGVVRFPIR